MLNLIEFPVHSHGEVNFSLHAIFFGKKRINQITGCRTDQNENDTPQKPCAENRFDNINLE